MTAAELDAKLQHSYEQSIAGAGRPFDQVFDELEREISSGTPSEGQEYGLTAALDRVRERDGLYGFVPSGRSFDIGLPETYRQTMWEFSQK